MPIESLVTFHAPQNIAWDLQQLKIAETEIVNETTREKHKMAPYSLSSVFQVSRNLDIQDWLETLLFTRLTPGNFSFNTA